MKLLIFIPILLSGICYAQLSEKIINDPNFEYPIYPTCKKHKGNNEKLKDCFEKNLWFDLVNLIGINSLDYYEKNVEGHLTKVIFTITPNGELTKLSYTEDSNPKLAKDLLRNILKTINYYKERNKKLQPAKLNGEWIEFTITLPVVVNYGSMN